MVSLSKLCEVDENGVKFEHPNTKQIMFLRPEDSIKAQNNIGSDIMMALDDVIKTTTEGPRMEEACDRTIRWIDRNIAAHEKQETQNLFPIIQGGLDKELRERCIKALVERDANGYAIGGLSGGEEKVYFCEPVSILRDSTIHSRQDACQQTKIPHGRGLSSGHPAMRLPRSGHVRLRVPHQNSQIRYSLHEERQPEADQRKVQV